MNFWTTASVTTFFFPLICTVFLYIYELHVMQHSSGPFLHITAICATYELGCWFCSVFLICRTKKAKIWTLARMEKVFIFHQNNLLIFGPIFEHCSITHYKAVKLHSHSFWRRFVLQTGLVGPKEHINVSFRTFYVAFSAGYSTERRRRMPTTIK